MDGLEEILIGQTHDDGGIVNNLLFTIWCCIDIIVTRLPRVLINIITEYRHPPASNIRSINGCDDQ